MKIILQGNNGEVANLIPYIDPESFVIEEEANIKNQVTFTLYATDVLASMMAEIETKLLIDGQTYIIKQVDSKYLQGNQSKQIVATHVFFESQSFRTVKELVSKKIFSISELLDYYFKGNEGGFTYQIHGNFNKVEVDTLSSGSVRDGVNLVLTKYPKTHILMDNCVVHVFSEERWVKKEQQVLHYYHDTQNVTLSVNSLDLSNVVRCSGGKNEKGQDYFSPFFVQDTQSISQFGKKYLEEIKDERFKDRAAMEKYAREKLRPEPLLTLQMVFNSDERPVLGKQYPFILHSMNYQTEVTIVGYRWFPLTPYKLSEVTFNNMLKNFLQYHNDVEHEIKNVKKEQKDSTFIVKQMDSKIDKTREVAKKALAGQVFGEVVKEIENH